jgi:hypothetical protein
MSEQQQDDGAVNLVGAGVPADQGLSSLGLLMQLGGNVFAAFGALAIFLVLFAMRGSGETLWVFLIFLMAIARSLFHRSAGTQLLYGGGAMDRLAGIRRYIGVSLLQTFATSTIMITKFHMAPRYTMAVAAGLALWPVVLAVLLTQFRFKQFKEELPFAEDKGFEGASILMTVLGLCGLVTSGAILLILLDLPGRALAKGATMFMVLAVALLVIRSFLHVQAGFSGLRETDIDRSVELSNRYANFGVISSFCAGGALLMWVMSGMNIIGLSVIVGVCWMLLAWPLVVRRFFSDRQFADLLAGDGAPIHRRSPDAGLTGLGWLLFAHAAFTASFVVFTLISGSDDSRTARELQSLTMFSGQSGSVRSIWWSVGLVILEGWAGFELVRMSVQSRAIASVFGAVGTAVTLYISWPMIKMFKGMGSGGGIQGQALQFASIAMSLIIPIATVVLVNRAIAPTARARFKAKPQPPSPTPAS